MSSAIMEHPDGLPQPQRNWAILTIALGLVMAVVDGSIAKVALPTIARDLDASPAFSIWIVNVRCSLHYLLATPAKRFLQ